MAFSPDGRQILTANEDPGNTAKLWDASSGKELRAFKGHRSWVVSAAFSPDGRRIVTGSDDQTAKVWDAVTGANLLTLTGHSDIIMSAAFSPDAQRIVTCSRDQTVKLWDATTGKELLTLNTRRGWIFSVAFSPDGRRIVAANWDGTATVWQAASSEQIAMWQQEEQFPENYAAAKLHERTISGEAAGKRALAARTRLPGGIRKWLLLLPLAIESGDALQEQQVAQESQLHPLANERSTVGQRELAWRALESEDHLIDFNEVVGSLTERSVVYAVCYVKSEAAQGAVSLKIASDDQAKVYLNGKTVYEFNTPRSYSAEEDSVDGLELKSGINVLVLKVVNATFDWKASVRLTDPTGQPLKGIEVRLAP